MCDSIKFSATACTLMLQRSICTPQHSSLPLGTPFMARLATCLEFYIHERMNNNPAWQGIKVRSIQCMYMHVHSMLHVRSGLSYVRSQPVLAGLHKRMTFQTSKMFLEAQGATSVQYNRTYMTINCYSVLAMANVLMANLNNVQSTLRCYCPMPTYLVRVNTRSWTTSVDREATLTMILTRITVSTGRTQILSCWDWPLTSLNSPFSGRSSSQTSQDRVNCVDKQVQVLVYTRKLGNVVAICVCLLR